MGNLVVLPPGIINTLLASCINRLCTLHRKVQSNWNTNIFSFPPFSTRRQNSGRRLRTERLTGSRANSNLADVSFLVNEWHTERIWFPPASPSLCVSHVMFESAQLNECNESLLVFGLSERRLHCSWSASPFIMQCLWFLQEHKKPLVARACAHKHTHARAQKLNQPVTHLHLHTPFTAQLQLFWTLMCVNSIEKYSCLSSTCRLNGRFRNNVLNLQHTVAVFTWRPKLWHVIILQDTPTTAPSNEG